MTWRLGREKPLVINGPPGTDTLVDALNTAYEKADALAFVEEGPFPGGFNDAILVAADAPGLDAQEIFDTGDLQVVAGEFAIERTWYYVNYGGLSDLTLVPCATQPAYNLPKAETVMSCEGTETTMTWPLTEPVMIYKGNEG